MSGVAQSFLTDALEFSDDALSSALSYVSGTGTAYNVSDLWDMAVSIGDILKPFCYTILYICLLLYMAEMLTRLENFRIENAIEIGLKLVLTRVFIDIVPDFLSACYQQVCAWITSVSSGGAETWGKIYAEEIEELFDSLSPSFWQSVGLFFLSVVMYIAIYICGLIIKVIAFGRMFEILVYIALSPVPCAFMPLGNGGGFSVSRITTRFIKSFIAVCLQGLVMVVIFRVFSSLEGNLLSVAIATEDASAAISRYVWNMLLALVVLVMAVCKSGGWAKNMIDA